MGNNDSKEPESNNESDKINFTLALDESLPDNDKLEALAPNFKEKDQHDCDMLLKLQQAPVHQEMTKGLPEFEVIRTTSEETPTNRSSILSGAKCNPQFTVKAVDRPNCKEQQDDLVSTSFTQDEDIWSDALENIELGQGDDPVANQSQVLAVKSHSLKYCYRDDQWSPSNPNGKRQYDRALLMHLRQAPLSLKLPEGLPNIEVVLWSSCYFNNLTKKKISKKGVKTSFRKSIGEEIDNIMATFLKNEPELPPDIVLAAPSARSSMELAAEAQDSTNAKGNKKIIDTDEQRKAVKEASEASERIPNASKCDNKEDQWDQLEKMLYEKASLLELQPPPLIPQTLPLGFSGVECGMDANERNAKAISGLLDDEEVDIVLSNDELSLFSDSICIADLSVEQVPTASASNEPEACSAMIPFDLMCGDQSIPLNLNGKGQCDEDSKLECFLPQNSLEGLQSAVMIGDDSTKIAKKQKQSTETKNKSGADDSKESGEIEAILNEKPNLSWYEMTMAFSPSSDGEYEVEFYNYTSDCLVEANLINSAEKGELDLDESPVDLRCNYQADQWIELNPLEQGASALDLQQQPPLTPKKKKSKCPKKKKKATGSANEAVKSGETTTLPSIAKCTKVSSVNQASTASKSTQAIAKIPTDSACGPEKDQKMPSSHAQNSPKGLLNPYMVGAGMQKSPKKKIHTPTITKDASELNGVKKSAENSKNEWVKGINVELKPEEIPSFISELLRHSHTKEQFCLNLKRIVATATLLCEGDEEWFHQKKLEIQHSSSASLGNHHGQDAKPNPQTGPACSKQPLYGNQYQTKTKETQPKIHEMQTNKPTEMPKSVIPKKTVNVFKQSQPGPISAKQPNKLPNIGIVQETRKISKKKQYWLNHYWVAAMLKKKNEIGATKKGGKIEAISGKKELTLHPGTDFTEGRIKQEPAEPNAIGSSPKRDVKSPGAGDACRPNQQSKGWAQALDNNYKLYRQAKTLLNQLTPRNFDALMNQVTKLEIRSEEQLTEVIDLLFEKAIDAPDFIKIYARTCKTLASVKISSANGCGLANFKKVMLAKCHRVIEKDINEELMRDVKIERIQAAKTEKERNKLTIELNDAVIESKRRLSAITRLMGELFQLNLLTSNLIPHYYLTNLSLRDPLTGNAKTSSISHEAENTG